MGYSTFPKKKPPSHHIMINLGQSPNQATWGWVKVTKTCTI